VNLYLVLRDQIIQYRNILFIIDTSLQQQLGSGDDNDDYIDDILCYQELLHSEIIDRCKFSNGHIIKAQLSSEKSILQEEFTTINGTERQDPTLNGKDLTKFKRILIKHTQQCSSSYLEHWSGEQSTVRFTPLLISKKMTCQPQGTTDQVTQVNITAMTSTEKFQHCRKSQQKLQG
jgi:hypothetical protein